MGVWTSPWLAVMGGPHGSRIPRILASVVHSAMAMLPLRGSALVIGLSSMAVVLAFLGSCANGEEAVEVTASPEPTRTPAPSTTPTARPSTAQTATPSPKSTNPDLLSYMQGDGSIWVFNFDDESALKVADPLLPRQVGHGVDRSWTFSPSGDQLAFDRYDDGEGNTGIAITSIAGDAQPEFLHSGSNPKWSPTGDYLLFEDEGRVRGISLLDRKVKAFDGIDIIHTPHPWFRDGVHFIAADSTTWAWYVLNVDTNERQPLNVPELERAQETITGAPIVSPVSDELVAQITFKAGYNVAHFDTSGRAFKILSPLPGDPWPGSGNKNPNWSPSGNLVSYIEGFATDPGVIIVPALVIIEADGSDRQILTDGVDIGGTMFSISCWLRSGAGIAFKKNNDLIVVDLENQQEQLIADQVFGFLCNR